MRMHEVYKASTFKIENGSKMSAKQCKATQTLHRRFAKKKDADHVARTMRAQGIPAVVRKRKQTA